MASQETDGASAEFVDGRRVVTAKEFREEITRATDSGQRSPLESLHLRELNLKSFEVTEFAFKNCDFSGADMTGSTFAGVTFENCLFQQTILDRANLVGSCFVNNCVLHLATMKYAEAHDAHFWGVMMTEVDATGANFQNSDFRSTELRDATLNLADLRQTKNLLPDETKMRGALLSKGGEDPWSALRRTYTGPRLLLNMVPVAIFVATLAVKTYGLYLVGVLQGIKIAEDGLTTYCERINVTCETWTVLEVLAGFHEGIWASAFVIFGIVYNALRFILTMVVSRLREHEDRTGASPPYKGSGSYQKPRYAHYVLLSCQWIMYGLFVKGSYGILTAEVKLVQ